MTDKPIHAIIPAGGAGTRLWPLSRRGRPKFLLDLTGAGRSPLPDTVERLAPVTATTTVVTGVAHIDAVAHQLPSVPRDNLLAEPSPRDSMAAIGLAAAVVAHRHGRDAVVGSFAEMFSMGAWACGWQPSVRGAAHRLGERPRAVTRAMAGGDVVSTVTADADAIGDLAEAMLSDLEELLPSCQEAANLAERLEGDLRTVVSNLDRVKRPFQRWIRALQDEGAQALVDGVDAEAALQEAIAVGEQGFPETASLAELAAKARGVVVTLDEPVIRERVATVRETLTRLGE